MTEPTPYRCPRCGGREPREQSLWSAVMLHWWLNPGLAVNELLMGQRLPRRVLLCARCQPSSFVGHEQGLVPCPSCGKLHPGALWSGSAAFGNWLGYACPDCEGRIPCLWNATSYLVVIATAPLWFLPVRLFGDRVRKGQARRMRSKRDGLGQHTPPLGQWLGGTGAVVGVVVAILATAAWPGTWAWFAACLLGGLVGGGAVGTLMGKVMESNLQARWKLAKTVEPLEGHSESTSNPKPVLQSGNRCPYCHDAVSAESAVACTGCLARHHPECWDDHKECATCGSTQRYGAVEETEGRPRRKPDKGKDAAG